MACAGAILQALERHGVPADEIDLINPHGTSTPLGDLREAQAFWDVFGDHTPEIAISRDQVDDRPPDGRRRAPSRAFHGAVASTTSARRPRSTTATRIPEINLNVVTAARGSMKIRYAISDNVGLGGHNGAVIFKRYDGD